jgi:hypothetical protein
MEPQILGTTVTAGPQLSDTLLNSNAPEVPEWLSAPTPEIPAVREATPTNREIMYMQFEYMFDHVLEQLAGGKTIKQTLDHDPRGYESATYIHWIKKDPMRTSRYEHAQLLFAEQLGAEIIEISDAEDSAEDVQRSKLRIDSRKWLMGVYNKRRYGETKTIEMGGSISIIDALAQAQARVIEGEVIDVTPRLENN